MGHKGGSETARKYGSEHFRQLAAKRKTLGGGSQSVTLDNSPMGGISST